MSGVPGMVQRNKPMQPIVMHDRCRKYHQVVEGIRLMRTLLSVNESSMACHELCLEPVILVRYGMEPGFLIAKPLLFGFWRESDGEQWYKSMQLLIVELNYSTLTIECDERSFEHTV